MIQPAPPIGHIATAAAERRIIARLRAAHATVPDRAVALENLRRIQSRRLARLARAGVVHEVGTGRWYLDEAVYAEFVAYRRRLAAIAVIAALLAGITVYVLSVNGFFA